MQGANYSRIRDHEKETVKSDPEYVVTTRVDSVKEMKLNEKGKTS